MKNTLYCTSVFIILCVSSILAQNNANKSIKQLKQECYLISLKDFDKSIELANIGISISLKEKDSISYAFFHRFLGTAYYFKGNYIKASDHYFKSIKILENNNGKEELGFSYNELAKLYRKTKKLNLAKETYEKALNIFTNLQDSAHISMIYNESGVVYEYEGKYEEALKRYNTSFYISQNLNDSVAISYALNNIAGLYSLQNKFNLAHLYLIKALQIRKQIKDSFALALNYTDLGSNAIADKKTSEALTYIDSSNIIAKNIHYLELESQNYLLISKAYDVSGNISQAYQYYKKYIKLKDSIFTKESENQLNELNTKYQSEKKDLELAKNKAELEAKEKQAFTKNIIIISIVVLCVLLFISSLLFYRKKQVEQRAKLDAEIASQKDIRTKAIIDAEEKERRRIAQDLHDGVGQLLSAAKLNLSNLESKIIVQTDEQKLALQNAVSLVDDSVKEVRAVSHNMMPNTLIKLGLASAVREFITKLGNAPTLKVDLEIVGLDNRLDNQVETVLYRVIQEVVNNIIKHAQASQISMQLIRHETELNVMIEDNGIGFDTNDLDNFEGIGLKGIQTRIAFLNGTVYFDSTLGRGTTIIIDIPLV